MVVMFCFMVVLKKIKLFDTEIFFRNRYRLNLYIFMFKLKFSYYTWNSSPIYSGEYILLYHENTV